jgi:hypothetical protein
MMQSTQCTVSRTRLGRSMGTGLVEDQVVPLATAPNDRSRPGGTIPGEGTLSLRVTWFGWAPQGAI